MKKIKVSRKNGQICIKTVLDKNETINNQEIAIFNAKLIRGLMRPVVEGPAKISYVAPDGVSLSQFLSAGITKNDFFLIFAQTLEVTKKIENHGFSYNSLLLDHSYVFVNQMTKEVNFIYRPVFTSDTSASIFVFFYKLIQDANFIPGEDISFVPGLVEFLHRTQFYSVEAIENYILQIYPGVYKQIQRQKMGQSEALHSTRLDANNETMMQQSVMQQNAGAQPIAPITPVSPLVYTPAIPEEDYEATTLLIEPDEDDMATTLLEEEGTMLLNEPAVPQMPKGLLIRTNTQEQFEVAKTEYKIGKDARFVDLHVTDNKAVSRQHASILIKEMKFYVVDLNSTNKTYVNGNVVAPETEYELNDGDHLMLGNEGFEFHIQE